MTTVLIVAIVSSVILLAGLIHFVRGRLRTQAEELASRHAGEGVVRLTPRANFFGLASRGMGQVRGNGVLLLTRTSLRFVLLLPRREVTIPLESIRSVETPRSHLGKTVGMRLLKVTFSDDQGQEDSAAWWVNDLDAWVEDLSRLTQS